MLAVVDGVFSKGGQVFLGFSSCNACSLAGHGLFEI